MVEPYFGSVAYVLATPPPLVEVKPTREVRTVAPVNEVAVDGGRAATLVGAARAWEYLLVWSPQGVVVRASLACDTQESNVVLAGDRFAHVCFQGDSYVVTGTLDPLKAHVALRSAGSGLVALAGHGTLIAGSTGSMVWRFDAARRAKLKTYPSAAIVRNVDGDSILVERSTAKLEVLSRKGRVRASLTLPHPGGALLRSGRIATIAKQRLVVSDLHGRTLLSRPVAAGATLADFDGDRAVYAVETRLHLLRVKDGRDVALRLRGQFGYATAKLSSGGLFYTYNTRAAKAGRAGYVSAAAVRALLRG
jgi:hypothetical protein